MNFYWRLEQLFWREVLNTCYLKRIKQIIETLRLSLSNLICVECLLIASVCYWTQGLYQEALVKLQKTSTVLSTNNRVSVMKLVILAVAFSCTSSICNTRTASAVKCMQYGNNVTVKGERNHAKASGTIFKACQHWKQQHLWRCYLRTAHNNRWVLFCLWVWNFCQCLL
jgi:hypothetical protein